MSAKRQDQPAASIDHEANPARLSHLVRSNEMEMPVYYTLCGVRYANGPKPSGKPWSGEKNMCNKCEVIGLEIEFYWPS